MSTKCDRQNNTWLFCIFEQKNAISSTIWKLSLICLLISVFETRIEQITGSTSNAAVGLKKNKRKTHTFRQKRTRRRNESWNEIWHQSWNRFCSHSYEKVFPFFYNDLQYFDERCVKVWELTNEYHIGIDEFLYWTLYFFSRVWKSNWSRNCVTVVNTHISWSNRTWKTAINWTDQHVKRRSLHSYANISESEFPSCLAVNGESKSTFFNRALC
jgi:hypothetical protein